MSACLSTYAAWAGPDGMAALAAATLAKWLPDWRTGRAGGTGLVPSLKVSDAAIVAVVAVSAVAALLAGDPFIPAGIIGIVAGIVAAGLGAGASRRT